MHPYLFHPYLSKLHPYLSRTREDGVEEKGSKDGWWWCGQERAASKGGGKKLSCPCHPPAANLSHTQPQLILCYPPLTQAGRTKQAPSRDNIKDPRAPRSRSRMGSGATTQDRSDKADLQIVCAAHTGNRYNCYTYCFGCAHGKLVTHIDPGSKITTANLTTANLP